MSRSLYDTDYYLWTQDQARRLRALTGHNNLDIEHLAEEVEDMGKAELRAAKSYLRKILVHLLKLATAPGATAAAHWRTEIVALHNDLLATVTPGMRQHLDLNKIWDRAKREAAVGLAEHGDALPDDVPDEAPVCLEALLSENLDIDAVLEMLRAR